MVSFLLNPIVYIQYSFHSPHCFHHLTLVNHPFSPDIESLYFLVFFQNFLMTPLLVLFFPAFLMLGMGCGRELLRGSGGSCVSTCLFGVSFFLFYHYFLNKHIYYDLTYHLHWDNSKLYISSSDLWSSTTT